MNEFSELISKYGFPIVTAIGLGIIIKYVWEWSTKDIKTVINDTNNVLIALIDRVRVLDNDLIRLNQKLTTVMRLRGKTIDAEQTDADKTINKKDTDIS